MRKFTKIGVENFGPFSNKVEFDLNALTIFTGPNNSGKSTLNKLIMFLSSFDIKYFDEIDQPYLGNYEFISLDLESIQKYGNLNEIINADSESKSLDFFFTFEKKLGNNENEIEIKLSYQIQNDKQAILNKIDISINKISVLNLSKENMYHCFNNDKLFNFEKERISPVHEYEKRLVKKNLDKKYNTLKWISKHSLEEMSNGNSQFALTMRQMILDYRENNIMQKNHIIELGFEDERDIPLMSVNPNILIQSDFCESVLNSFRNSNNLGETNFYKTKLKEKGIRTESDFIKCYNDFENQLIVAIYDRYFSSLNTTRKLSKQLIKKEFPTALRDIGTDIMDFETAKKLVRGRNKSKFPEEFTNILKEYSVVESKRATNFISGKYEFSLTKKEIKSLIKSSKSDLVDMFLNELELNDNVDLPNKIGKSIEELSKVLIEGIILGLLSSFEYIFGESFFCKSFIHKGDTPIENSYLFEKSFEYKSHFFSFGKKIIERKYKDELEFINGWLEKLNIGSELIISPILHNKETIGFKYMLKKNSTISPLIKQGLGIKKLLSILIYLVTVRNTHLIFEEPEVNLHPSLQSKLADIFFNEFSRDGFEQRSSIIIETHSEYLIRKLQFLIATYNKDDTKLNKNKISIYYMNDQNQIPDGEEQVYKLDLREDGFMNNDFGKGFFDESSTLSLSLLNGKHFN